MSSLLHCSKYTNKIFRNCKVLLDGWNEILTDWWNPFAINTPLTTHVTGVSASFTNNYMIAFTLEDVKDTNQEIRMQTYDNRKKNVLLYERKKWNCLIACKFTARSFGAYKTMLSSHTK